MTEFWFSYFITEICLSSNVCTCTAKSYPEHHFKLWYDRGHPCVISVSTLTCGLVRHLLGSVQLFVRIYKSEQHSDFGGLVGLRKMDVRISVQEIIRTPGNPTINLKCMDFFGREYSYLAVGGSAKIQTLYGCVNQHIQIIGRSLRPAGINSLFPLSRPTLHKGPPNKFWLKFLLYFLQFIL